MRINSAQSGMTLIQMAGILLIISIMMVPFFQIQSLSKKNEVRAQSKGQVSDVAQALVKFALENGRYPLPANPNLALSNPNSGDEAIILFGASEADRDLAVRTAPIDGCGIPAPDDKLVCANGVATPYASGTAENRVIIGTIPFTALGLTPQQSLDEFGSKMTYAVTYGLTKASTFSNDKGNISVKDQDSYDITMDGANASTKTHFVVISHGPNKLGAFPVAGGGRTCTASAVKGTLENENCNNDANFRLVSIRKGSDAATVYNVFTQRMPGTNTTNTFDDLVVFRTSLNTGNWTAQNTVSADGTTPVYQTYLGYRNGNENVVMGTNTTPGQTGPLSPGTLMKQVGSGQVQVDCIGSNCTGKNIVQADKVYSKYLCSTKDRNNNTIRGDDRADACFRVKFLTQTNLQTASAVNGMVVDNVNTVSSPATLYEVRSGQTSDDSGMLKILKKTLDQAQSPGIAPVDDSGSAYTEGGVAKDTCGLAGAKGINTQGKLICR